MDHLITEALAIEGRAKALMAAVEEHDLEGIVAKRKSDPYRRGASWWKIKNRAYSQAEGRHELMNRTGRSMGLSQVSRWHDDILRYRRQAGNTKLAGE